MLNKDEGTRRVENLYLRFVLAVKKIAVHLYYHIQPMVTVATQYCSYTSSLVTTCAKIVSYFI